MWTYLIKTCCSYDRLPFCFASSASLCLFVSFLCCYSNQKSYMSQLQTLNTSGSLSIKHSQLSAVTNIWLFMVTICILFVMIALHQYFPLQPSRKTIADTFLSTISSTSSPFRGFLISSCCRSRLGLLVLWGSGCHTRGGWEIKLQSFFSTGCCLLLVGFMSDWTQQDVL